MTHMHETHNSIKQRRELRTRLAGFLEDTRGGRADYEDRADAILAKIEVLGYSIVPDAVLTAAQALIVADKAYLVGEALEALRTALDAMGGEG